jgi:uncharacterized protein (DUF1778 family)
MRAEKTASISFRVTPTFRRLLEQASARKHRSQTNLIELLSSSHCRTVGLIADEVTGKRRESRFK